MEWARPLLAKRRYDDLIDERMIDLHGFDEVQVHQVLNIAAACVDSHASRRPTMKNVVKMLEESESTNAEATDTIQEDRERHDGGTTTMFIEKRLEQLKSNVPNRDSLNLSRTTFSVLKPPPGRSRFFDDPMRPYFGGTVLEPERFNTGR